ncbi:dTDP-glucose 4,6-dehydratase [Alkalihalophilus pseudofirmus]|uniref:dTDP-glucose 4,6-dehydratase n=1 Tax=Alkalihalophilus pseudofirmus TaxID=79885 RepID=UPI00259B41E6|nr:dTDP-glucose 4,6-dehydratase [Alkalihalophilus pseudofirmus]WEG15367.1 dTDP-glucose 4,6-dehydratase [Alkalihalophilus pseudofirmus]
MQKILVTGGAGFIGSNFIRYALNHSDAQITNIDALTYAGNESSLSDLADHLRYQFIKVNLVNEEEVEAAFSEPYDLIIHFAAESHVDRSILDAGSFINTNILGTHQLLKKVLEGKASKMIHVSTDEVYGSLNVGDEAFTESTPIAPNNPYAASKASSDLFVQAFHHTYQVPVMITRCSNNYGPYQHPEKLIPTIIRKALKEEPIPLYGDGLNIRDWLFVEDHCRAIWNVAEKGKAGEVYNIGGNHEKTNLEVVKTILDYLKKDRSLITFVEDRLGHDRRYAINSSKIQQQLGWQPETTFDEGLKKTIDWYVNNELWVRDVLKKDKQL